MPLAAPSTDFVSAIRDALVDAGMLKDQIVVLDPNDTTTTPYIPTDDTGGTSDDSLILGPRAAYIKALGANVIDDSGILQGRMQYRIQFIPKIGDPVITKGMIVRVLAGGDNSNLARYVFSVLGQPTGSIAVLGKLICQTSGTPAPIWTAP